MRRLSITAVVVATTVSICAQTTEHRLSAREIFYGAGVSAERTAPSPRVKKKSSEATKRKPAVPQTAEPGETTAEPVATNRPNLPGGAVAQYVANKVSPLGLRYSILKRDDAGDYSEVSPDATFHSGDRIRVLLETNDTGYLYVVQQGSSNKWEPLYPSSDSGGTNQVQPQQAYKVPPDAVFTFDSRTGTEKLFIILSRQPVSDPNDLIYSLDDNNRKDSGSGHAMLAQNLPTLGDDLVKKIRDVYSRDLLIEKVDDQQAQPAERPVHKSESPSRPGEKAVYVVNTRAGANARVVADISLRHE